MSNCIYAGMTAAKNGTEVPVFNNRRTLFSSYNPERDADTFVTAHKDAFEGAGCILIGGIGNGLHLVKIAAAYPKAKIIAFEADDASLAFSLSHITPELKNAYATYDACRPESSLILTSAERLRITLLSNYIPALHGNFAFAAVRSWADALEGKASLYLTLINDTIADISADYSVQAQFGKLWHRNILINLLQYDSMKEALRFNASNFSSEAHKAAIIGAGPSLDETIQKLIENRSEYCIFATDTTFGTLKAAGITPDFVVTVDSQHISEKHFVGQNLAGTILASDLTGNSSIIKNAIDQNAQVLFFHNNHPLSQLFENWISDVKENTSPFPVIDSGAGTVLHAAADLARKLGFSELSFFGADFAYTGRKPYTKGTYLEKQYYAEDERTFPAETAYSCLMYRSPVIQLSEDTVTTEVLSRYKKALESYLKTDISSLFTDRKLSASESNISTQSPEKKENPFQLSDFIPWYIEKLQKKDEKVYFSLLPLAAWYKKNFSNADTECVYAFAVEQTANVGRIQCRLQKK